MRPTVLLPVAIVLAACGGTSTSASPSDSGTPQDHSAPPTEASLGDAPSEGAVGTEGGSGTCCPIASDPCSACGPGGGGPGGWAPSAAECQTSGPCDGYIGFGTDSHGCPVLVTGMGIPGTKCCGCPEFDAGGGNADAGTRDGDANGGKGVGETCTPSLSQCAAGLGCCACPLPGCTAPPTCETLDQHGFCPG